MMALGPSSRGSKPLSFDDAVARFASAFFTTVIFSPCARNLRRIRLFFSALIPRGLITATVSTSLNRLAISFSISDLTGLLMVASLHVQVNGRRHRTFQHDLLEIMSLRRLGFQSANR